MKTFGVLLVLLMITAASNSEAGVCVELKAKIDQLAVKVDALIQKDDKKDPFVKLNSAPVCFSTHNSQFGSFNASTGGNLMKIKLVHLYGYVTCLKGHDHLWSHWGCGYYPDQNGNVDYTGVSLTTASNTILFPPSQIVRSDKWSLISGYSSRSPELVMSMYDTPVTVSAGQELRLWYTEDLTNTYEHDDAGRVCADVFGYFM